MSQPVLSGEQLWIFRENNTVRVTTDPGFSSDNGDGCPYRWPWIYNEHGDTVKGYAKPTRELAVSAVTYTRQDLAEARFRLDPGTYTLRVYGGTYFKGWGDVPDDYIEWGYTDQGKNPSGVPRANEVTFTVPSAVPPPPTENPSPSALPAELRTVIDNVAAEARLAKADVKAWAAANPGEAQAIWTYLGDLAMGDDAIPPDLKTHRGRAVSGILQTYAIARRLAK